MSAPRDRAKEAANARARRAARKAAGKCTECDRPAAPGVTLCKAHLLTKRRVSREGSRRRYYERKAAGLCYRCGKVPATVNGACAPCEGAMWRNRHGERSAELARQLTRAKYHRRKAAGQCTRCGKTATPGYATCTPCAERDAAGERRRNPGGNWTDWRERQDADLRFVFRDLRRFNRWYLVVPDDGLVFGPYSTAQEAAGDAAFRGLPDLPGAWEVTESPHL